LPVATAANAILKEEKKYLVYLSIIITGKTAGAILYKKLSSTFVLCQKILLPPVNNVVASESFSWAHLNLP
jgi:hypothetical protein